MLKGIAHALGVSTGIKTPKAVSLFVMEYGLNGQSGRPGLLGHVWQFADKAENELKAGHEVEFAFLLLREDPPVRDQKEKVILYRKIILVK